MIKEMEKEESHIRIEMEGKFLDFAFKVEATGEHAKDLFHWIAEKKSKSLDVPFKEK
jgi:hypothetical protein